jgi:hypothetical protein
MLPSWTPTPTWAPPTYTTSLPLPQSHGIVLQSNASSMLSSRNMAYPITQPSQAMPTAPGWNSSPFYTYPSHQAMVPLAPYHMPQPPQQNSALLLPKTHAGADKSWTNIPNLVPTSGQTAGVNHSFLGAAVDPAYFRNINLASSVTSSLDVVCPQQTEGQHGDKKRKRSTDGPSEGPVPGAAWQGRNMKLRRSTTPTPQTSIPMPDLMGPLQNTTDLLQRVVTAAATSTTLTSTTQSIPCRPSSVQSGIQNMSALYDATALSHMNIQQHQLQHQHQQHIQAQQQQQQHQFQQFQLHQPHVIGQPQLRPQDRLHGGNRVVGATHVGPQLSCLSSASGAEALLPRPTSCKFSNECSRGVYVGESFCTHHGAKLKKCRYAKGCNANAIAGGPLIMCKVCLYVYLACMYLHQCIFVLCIYESIYIYINVYMYLYIHVYMYIWIYIAHQDQRNLILFNVTLTEINRRMAEADDACIQVDATSRPSLADKLTCAWHMEVANDAHSPRGASNILYASGCVNNMALRLMVPWHFQMRSSQDAHEKK